MAKFEAWSNVVVNDLSDDLISSVDVYYYLSSSSISLSGGSWVSSPPNWVDGKYYWQKTITTFKDNTTSESDPVCITGAKGATGATGTGIASITEEYYLSTSKETPTGGSWVTEQPAWESGKYIWTRSKIVYKNPTSTEYTDPYCDTSWEAANDVRDELLEEITLMQTTLSGVETKVDANSKSITDKVWQKDITEAVNNYDSSTVNTIRDRVTVVEQDIDGLKTTVSDVQTEIDKKADGTTVQTLSEKFSTMEQDAEGFKTTVEETYATKDELNNSVSTVKSEWTQRADEIESSVSDLEGNVSTNTQNIEGITSRVESAEGDIASLKITDDEIKASVTDAETNAKSFATQEAERIKTEVQSEIDGVESSFEQRAGLIESSVTDVENDLSTYITQTDEKISLLATKEEVNESLDGYYTKEETDSLIQVESESITLQVSKTYSTKEETAAAQTAADNAQAAADAAQSDIDDMSIGGRQILPNTKTMDGYGIHSTGTTSVDSEGFTVASFAATDTLAWRYVNVYDPILYSVVRGKEVTLSFDAKSSDPNSYNSETTRGLNLTFSLCTADSNTRTLYRSQSQYTKTLTDDWTRITHTVTLEDSFFTSGSGIIDDTTRFYVQVYSYSLYPVDIRKIKLEFGNVATDWSPAPEDIEQTLDDTVAGIHETIAEQNTIITNTCSEIIMQALESYVETSDYDTFKQTVEAQLQIMSDEITMNFTTTTEQISDVEDDMQTRFSEFYKHFSFSETGLSILDSNGLELVLDSGIIKFLKNGTQFGWWDGVDFHTGNIVVEVNERAQFGNFAFVPRSDGSLSFLKVGE